MTNSNRTTSVTLLANITQYLAALRTAGAATAAFAAGGTKLASQVGVVNAKMAGLATGIGFTAATGVATMAQFEYAMSRVQATTEANVKVMGDLREAAMAVAGDTIFTPKDAAEGIAILSKAGVQATDILGGGLAGALNLAAAGEMQVEEAAQIAASALNTFRLEGEKMPHVADLLASTANEAQGEVHDLGFALRMTAAVAAQTGMTIEETMAGLGAMANRGLLNSDAGTSMKSFLIHLVPTTDTAAREMEKIGLSAFNAQGEFIGLEAVAEQLRLGLADLSEEQQLMSLRTIFGTDAIRAAAVMYEEGAAGIREWKNANRDGYAEMFTKTLNDNLIGDVKKLGGEFEALFIDIAQGTNGPLRTMTQMITGLAGSIRDANNGEGWMSWLEAPLIPDGKNLTLWEKAWNAAPWGDIEPITVPVELQITSPSGEWNSSGGPAQIALEAQRQAANDLLGSIEDLAVTNNSAAGSADGLASASYGAAAAARELAAASGGAAGGVATLAEQMESAIDGAINYIDVMQGVSASGDALAGMADTMRESATYTIPGGSGGGGSKTKAQRAAESAASKARTKAMNDEIKAMREADQKKMNAEIESARKRAQAKAEARADAEARGEVTSGVKDFIETDKKAKRGEDIDGFNNTGSVGEKAGSLTDKEQKALDKKIDGIRERHRKAIDAQVKGMRDANKAANDVNKAVSGASGSLKGYNTTLDKNTEAGRKNRAMFSGLVDEAENAMKMAFAEEMLRSNDVEKAGLAAKDALNLWYDEIVATGEQTGYAKIEVQKLLAEFGLIPDEIPLLFKIKVDDSEMTQWEKDWKKRIEAGWKLNSPSNPEENKPTPTPKPKPKPTTSPTYVQDPRTGEYVRRAGGGEVWGAGSSTSDSISARLSNGEYVVRASQYAANRDLVKAINGSTGKVGLGGGSVGVLIEGGVHVSAPNPAAAGENVIDELDMYAYRKGAVR